MSDGLDLRALHQHHEPDSEFRAALRQRVAQIVSGDGSAVPDPDGSVVDLVELAPGHASRRRPWPALLLAAAAAAVTLIAVLIIRSDESTVSVSDSQSPLLGTWVSIDGDLSRPTMVIEVSTDGVVEMVVVDDDLDDDFASVCSGSSSTMMGTGRFETDNVLVFPSPVLTCDDGSQPEALSGPPLEEQLQNLTFTYRPEGNTLIDNFGERWTRDGAQDTFHPMVRWPQASLKEVQEAQELADAGDPNFTWQLEPNMESIASILIDGGQVDTPEILARVVRKRFGWEDSALIQGVGEAGSQGIRAHGFQLIRCEPGKANPLWPNDPLFGGCAPTIDDFHYETVEIYVTQPGKKGPEGIWAVSVLPSEVSSLSQIAPITDVEIAAIVDAFLQARIAGEGAEQHLGRVNSSHVEIGYLYATSTGAPYERAEFEGEDGEIEDPGPLGGATGLLVRLFADGGQTVVEQTLNLEHQDGRWVILQHEADQNTENGVPLPPP
jgi:hypothetical protein